MFLKKSFYAICALSILLLGCSAGSGGSSPANSSNSGGGGSGGGGSGTNPKTYAASFGNISNNESLVSLAPNILVQFESAVSNLTAQNIVFSDGSNTISSKITPYGNNSYLVLPSISLESNTQYTLVVESSILDSSGNNLESSSIGFVTGNTINPVLLNQLPTNIEPESSLDLLFNLAVAPINSNIVLTQLESSGELIPYSSYNIKQLSNNYYQINFLNNYIEPHNQYSLTIESGINSFGNSFNTLIHNFTVGNNVQINYATYSDGSKFQILESEANCSNISYTGQYCISDCTVDFQVKLNATNLYPNERIVLSPSSSGGGSINPSNCVLTGNNQQCIIMVKGANLHMEYFKPLDTGGGCSINKDLRTANFNFNITNSSMSAQYIESSNLSINING